MPFTLTSDTFLACVKQSGLIDEASEGSILDDLKREGVDVRNPHRIADALVRNGTLTSWQAEHLLRGRRRGFVIGKYRLLSLLGRGGSNAVYLAEHALMRRRCALKILPAKYVEGARLARFYEEARAVALLQHINIVRAYDICKEMDGSTEIHFIVMEYVEGESLQERVDRDGPLPVIEAANYVRQVANGLAHAHAAGIVHRDVKPANLLVNRDGVVKILDLGLAKLFDERSSSPSSPQKQVFGTADFLSPEQALDSESVDARSDIYSLGCTFYFLLAGRPPFNEGTFTQRLISHQFEHPKPIIEMRPDVPADLASILERMMAKKVAERLQSAELVAEQLREWLVANADRPWLQKNPGLLGGGAVQDSAPLSGGSPPVPVPIPVLPGNDPLADRALLEFQALQSSTATQSILERRRPRRSSFGAGYWDAIQGYWNDRRGRELIIAAVLFLALCIVAAWNWLR